jgi:hypothetical protein
MTGLMIAAVVVLFAVNLGSVLSGKGGLQTYLKYNEVKGIAVKHNNLLYTLNFQQQNDLITFINESVPALSLNNGVRQPPDIEQIIIYQFGDKPDLVITPITYLNNQLVYSMPQWDNKRPLMEMSNGQLRKLLSQTYDH